MEPTIPVQTGPLTTAVQGGDCSSKAAQGTCCSITLANTLSRVESLRPLQLQRQSQSTRSHHGRPPQLSLGTPVWLLKASLWSSYTQAFGSQTWVPFGLALLGYLFYMQSNSLVCTPLPPEVVFYRGSLSTVLAQNLLQKN